MTSILLVLPSAVALLLGCALVRSSRARDLEARRREARHAQELSALSELALHDPLTGLPNRVLLHDRLRHALSSQRRRGGLVGVLFLDLDGFKAVNDGWGHGVGDEVLATVASRLRAGVRAGDTPSRLSGDEFVVVCEDVEDAAAMAGAAARLEAAVAAPIVLGERTICLGVSVGTALCEPSGDPHDTPSHAAARLLAVADSRMYDVKRARQLRLAEMGVLNRLAAEAALHLC